MDRSKRRALAQAGWRVGSADEFLGLTPAESKLVEMHLALAKTLRDARATADVTQAELARRLGSSQSRVAKMESGDPTVSLELLIRAHLALGASRRTVGRAIGRPMRIHGRGRA
jgi:DNA-binding XRE family transcriptional regulator